jgi:hypothetical protein
MQAGFVYITTDANGFGILTWPKAFPGGVISIQLQSGDDTIFNDLNMTLAGAAWGTSAISRTGCVFRIYGASGGVRTSNWPNKKVLVSYLAIGY